MLTIKPFALERYFARHEFTAKYLLSCSDCEPISLTELLALADAESKQLWQDLTLAYTDTCGHPVLRQAIAQTYEGMEPENVLVMVPEEGIFLFMQTLLKPGDHMVCTFPGYQSLYELARSMGCEVSMWELEENQGWRPDLKKLAGLMRDNTRLVVINFPHNPTGYLPGLEEYKALVDLVRQSGAYLFSDEMYRFLEFDPKAMLPSACELYPKAVSLCGLSKAFGLPGLRMGWLVTRDLDVMGDMIRLKDYTTICNSAPGEILGIIALRAREQIVGRHKARIRRNLNLLDAFMRTHADYFMYNPPLAGSICLPRLTAFEDTRAFCDNLVKETGIMLVPSALFEYGNHHVRIGFGRDNFPEVLQRFGRSLGFHS